MTAPSPSPAPALKGVRPINDHLPSAATMLADKLEDIRKVATARVRRLGTIPAALVEIEATEAG